MKVGSAALLGFLFSFLLLAQISASDGSYSRGRDQDSEADKLAGELLHLPGGLNALSTKLSTRSRREKEQAEADAAASAVIGRAAASPNPRFKRYARHIHYRRPEQSLPAPVDVQERSSRLQFANPPSYTESYRRGPAFASSSPEAAPDNSESYIAPRYNRRNFPADRSSFDARLARRIPQHFAAEPTMQQDYAAAQQQPYIPQHYREPTMQRDYAAAQQQPYTEEDTAAPARPLLSMRAVADAQAAVEAAVSARRPAPPAAAIAPAAAPPPVAAAQPAQPSADEDPRRILKALQASMHPTPAAPPPAAPSPASPRVPVVPAPADAGTSDADGFDWLQLAPKGAGVGYESDPAMRALAREAESLDDVYDPAEDPSNLGPGPSKKAQAGAYWTGDSPDDAWWQHGGEDGMT